MYMYVQVCNICNIHILYGSVYRTGDADAIRRPAHTALALLELARTHAQQATS